MVRFYIRISGRVQGVGFRYFVAQTASLYSITGWVRNLEDGDVELEAQGIQEDIDAFIERVRQGNRYSIGSGGRTEIPDYGLVVNLTPTTKNGI